MVNECQWCDRLCLIIKEMELFVSQKEEIIFCYNGSDIRYNEKNIFCDMSYLKSKIKDYFKEIEQRRRCEFCKINKSCSKCISTFPFSEKGFCDIRRKGKVKGLIDILQAHNKLSRFVSNIRTLFKDKDYQQTAST